MSGCKVREVMTDSVTCVSTSTPLKMIVRLLAQDRVSAVPVLDQDGRLVGVVSEADLMAKVQYQGQARPDARADRRERQRHAKADGNTAGELMSSPAIAIFPDLSVVEAARIMHREQIKRLPVVDADGRVTGVLSRSDVLKVLLRPDHSIRSD